MKIIPKWTAVHFGRIFINRTANPSLSGGFRSILVDFIPCPGIGWVYWQRLWCYRCIYATVDSAWHLTSSLWPRTSAPSTNALLYRRMWSCKHLNSSSLADSAAAALAYLFLMPWLLSLLLLMLVLLLLPPLLFLLLVMMLLLQRRIQNVF